MASFCKQCSEDIFGEDFGDFTFDAKDAIMHCLCEDCGPECIVTPDGTCISEICLKQHGLKPPVQDDIIMTEQQIACWMDTQ